MSLSPFFLDPYWAELVLKTATGYIYLYADGTYLEVEEITYG